MIRDVQTVFVLAYDRAPTFELSIPFEVFGSAAVDGRCRVVTLAAEPGELRTEHGWVIPIDPDPPAPDAGDLLLVAGWRDVAERPPASVLATVTDAAARGATVASLCTGAFVLAAAGLLDGRGATTHWRWAQQLAERYPQVDVDAGVLYVDAGDVLTSAGTAAGIDLCLHLVRRAHGAGVANAVARQMIVNGHREGGQAQFRPQVVAPSPGVDAVDAVTDWMLANLHRPLTLAELAARSHLSTRQFVRRFRESTGTSPYQWILARRVASACELLESSDVSVEQVARLSGFGDATTLRNHFRQQVGTTPTHYRLSFARR
jgi:transcriptional regulator GlxA family with amidase domain